MTEMSELRADVRALIEQGTMTAAEVAGLSATLRAHIAQQGERTSRRDDQIAAILRNIEDHDQRISAQEAWHIRSMAIAGVVGSAAAVGGAPLMAAVVAAWTG